MADSSTANSGGIGFIGLLTIVFIALKLTGFIDWSWWWVLAPLWVSALVFVVILSGIFIWAASDDRRAKRFRRW